MPEPIIRSGLKSSQSDAPRAAGVMFPRPEAREPGTTDEDLIFESFADFYRLQINSPEVSVNLVTGTKTKAKNEFVQFVNGVFVPRGDTKKRDIDAILGSKSFGEPFRALVWLRSDRQKLEVGKAIASLTDQLKDRPDLISMVSRRLKELAGAGPKFTLPTPPEQEPTQAPEPAQGL